MEHVVYEYFQSMNPVISCPVADIFDGDERVIGSATMIMPGMFLTATHVVQDWHDRSTGNKGVDVSTTEPEDAGDFKVKIWQTLKDGRLAEWHADEIVSMVGYDVAILIDHGTFNDVAKELIDKDVLPLIRFDLHPPKVGGKLLAIGYPKTQTKKTENGHQHLVNYFSHEGVVEDIKYEGAGLLKYPCFQTDIEADGGMSGCPVLKDSLICGIVSSGYAPTKDVPKYTTFVSSLWSIFTAKLPPNLTGHENVSLLELANMGFLTVIGRNHIKHGEDGDYWQEVVDDCPDCSNMA